MSSTTTESSIHLDDLDCKIINRLQEGFPLVRNPFARAAIQIGCTEQELIDPPVDLGKKVQCLPDQRQEDAYCCDDRNDGRRPKDRPQDALRPIAGAEAGRDLTNGDYGGRRRPNDGGDRDAPNAQRVQVRHIACQRRAQFVPRRGNAPQRNCAGIMQDRGNFQIRETGRQTD